LTLKGKVIVANTGDDTLTCVDFGNRHVVETISLEELIAANNKKIFRLGGPFIGPYDMVSNDKGIIYCTNAYDNSIFKIDIENKEILDYISVGSCPTCIKHFGKYLYIANSDSNSVSIIDEKNFSLVTNIPVGEKPIDIEIDEYNMKMYVANSNGYSINVIDLIGKNNNVIKLSHNPIKIILEEDHMYILLNINNSISSNSNISIMNLKTYEKQEIVNLKGIFNTMLKINGSEIIFLTNIDKGYLYRMNIKKRNLLSKIHLTGMPNKLEWDKEKLVFISNISTNTLTILDIDKNIIVDNIRVGQEPNGILIFN
jgi:YVTN family beta-propeller protein